MADGQIQVTPYFDNTGGLNISDSLFRVTENQSVGGFNYNFLLTGGFQSRLGMQKINAVADTQLKTLGLGLYNTQQSAKDVIRAAGTKIQVVDTDTPSFTDLSEDTSTASTDFLTSGSSQTVSFAQFNTALSNILWAAGGGMDLPRGVYSTSKATKNGADPATGSFTATRSATGGSWTATGTYFWAVVLRKAGTQAESNAVLDVSATISATSDKVTINFSGLTGLDTTKYDEILLYRSSVGGASGFTAGNLVKTLPSTTVSFVDKGNIGNPDELLTQNVARTGNVVLDNSVLPSGTYNVITLFKRRLVTATGSTLYLSDINKSESWPLTNYITVPSGGVITALAVISFTSPQAQSLDEILVIFKEREVWVLTGNDYTDWSLKFIDQTGCVDQSLIVVANGFLSWIDFRGIYLWDGSSKPIYCSRLLEPLFSRNGDLDKTKLSIGNGEFLRKENTIIWYLSNKTYGEQKYAIKMDLRLTLPRIEQQLTGRNLDAVLIQDTYSMPIYASLSYIPSSASDEMMIVGDDAGYVYFASDAYTDAGSAIKFTYKTKPLDQSAPNVNKMYHKVIVWVSNIGDWDLSLDYWTDFKTADSVKSTRTLPLSSDQQTSLALWDIAIWDVAIWDDFVPSPSIKPVIFNLEPGVSNNNQGTALQLQFRNENPDEPVQVHGFSVHWSEMGGITERF
jgi:hypothetical protein